MKEIKFFIGITLLVSAVLEGLYIYTEASAFAAVLLFTPAIISFLTKFIFCRNEKKVLHFSKCKVRYLLAALLLPICYLGIPYFIFWMKNPGSMQINFSWAFIGNTIIGMLSNMILVMGEEIGWRGFLVPKMSGLIGERKTLFITGAIWGIWHCPLLIAGIYLPDMPNAYKVPMFLIVIIAVGIIIGILTMRSGSIWPAILLHAAHNTLGQDVFGKGTVGPFKDYLVGEAGFLTVIIVIGIAIFMFRKRTISK